MLPTVLSKKWVDEGLLTEVTLKKMENDLEEYKKAISSQRLISFFSSIGALLIGLAALAFMAANWSMLTSSMRIILFVCATLLSFSAGNVLMADKWKMPRVGFSFVFLAHLLFGVTLFLVAQQYQVSLSNHWYFLVWILGLVPGIYYYNSRILTMLAIVIFYVWLMYAAGSGFFTTPESVFWFVVFSFFGLVTKGLLHMRMEKTYDLGRLMLLCGMFFLMIFFYFATFSFVGKNIIAFGLFSSGWDYYMILVLMFLSLFGIVLLPGALEKILPGNKAYLVVGVYAFSFLLTVWFCFNPAFPYNPLIFSLFFFALSLAICTIGYLVGRMQYVNLGMFWLFIFLLSKYVDYFWDLLPKSVFFFIGGLLLVLGGGFLEKKRKSLQEHIAH